MCLSDLKLMVYELVEVVMTEVCVVNPSLLDEGWCNRTCRHALTFKSMNKQYVEFLVVRPSFGHRCFRDTGGATLDLGWMVQIDNMGHNPLELKVCI